MLNIISVINIFKNINTPKIALVFILIIFFTFLFCWCDPSEFSGLISIHKLTHNIHTNQTIINKDMQENKQQENIQYYLNEDNLLKLIFNRLYFVIISTTTVGFGDIIPISIRSRILTMMYVVLLFIISFS